MSVINEFMHTEKHCMISILYYILPGMESIRRKKSAHYSEAVSGEDFHAP